MQFQSTDPSGIPIGQEEEQTEMGTTWPQQDEEQQVTSSSCNTFTGFGAPAADLENQVPQVPQIPETGTWPQPSQQLPQLTPDQLPQLTPDQLAQVLQYMQQPQYTQ